VAPSGSHLVLSSPEHTTRPGSRVCFFQEKFMYRDPLPFLESADACTVPRALRVGMIGIGAVGAATFRVLARNRRLIKARAGRSIEIVAVSARNCSRAAGIVGDGVRVLADPLQLAADPDIDVLLELAGGTGAARDWVLAAIAHGKSVVTANKALLAQHGEEIFALAHARGVAVAHEAAVAGCIPIVQALREGLAANRIDCVAGIVNGTSNFILGRMRESGMDFAAALAEAQALGYAEANPAFDIDGTDAAHKLALLAAHAFGALPRFSHVHVQGIRHLQPLDVRCAEQLGYRIKLLAVARRRRDAVELRVAPTLVPARHLLAQVDGVMNVVMVQADAAGTTLHYGAGAGGEATASAVIADLVGLARHRGAASAPPLSRQALAVLPRGQMRAAHYLRVPLQAVADLAALVTQLGADGVAVRQANVACPDGADGSPQALLLTDAVDHADLARALARLAAKLPAADTVTALPVESLDA
jgi:homoserine dehydrogenase